MARKKPAQAKRKIEQYDHKDKTRANNPPVGLVTPKTDPDQGRKTYQYDPHLDPQLQWAGKAERLSFEVPTASLHVHERIDPKTIIRAVKKRNGDSTGHTPCAQSPAAHGVCRILRQQSLFEEPEENPPLREAVDFYKHAHGWSNRLIAGDSLVVMNSLLEKEGMAGKVQMIYIDPPYGIKYGSNFQPFVNKRDVKDGNDQDLTQEPEMILAFRDTWELGIHSYLTYLRDRLYLARDLLDESGSCCVQIGEANVHVIRQLLDEVFGVQNCVAQIAFTTTTSEKTVRIAGICDYMLWYAKNSESLKFRPLFTEKQLGGEGGTKYKRVEFPDGTTRSVTECNQMIGGVISNAKVFRLDTLTSQRPGGRYAVKYEGCNYRPEPGYWKPSEKGFAHLIAADRVRPEGRRLAYVRYFSDFPYYRITNVWDDLSGIQSRSDAKIYCVQTPTKLVERCVLMTTDPGDLILDPTCGSGTVAYVAEQWGRRWITCDTSRVAVTLAKQRLMTTLFDYYELAKPDEGIGSGFVYKTVSHVTLKSIANNPEIHEGMTRVEIDAAIAKYAEQETLYDQPLVDKSKVRVTGPFTVEAVPAPAVRPVTEVVIDKKAMSLDDQPTLPGVGELDGQAKLQFTEDVSITRYGETHRQRQWRDELLAAGIRGKGGQRVEFSRLEPLGGTKWLQCEGETKPSIRHTPCAEKPTAHGVCGIREGNEMRQRVVVSFGPEYAPLEQRQVEMALEEAVQLKPTPQVVVFAAFQFDPEAAKDIDETKWPGVTLLKVQMNTDLLTEDLKKNRSSNESYWLMGQPDVELRQIKKGDHKDGTRRVPNTRSVPNTLYEIEVHGFDYYNTRTGSIESGDTTKIAMWMLDPDYDGRSLFPRQVFFPMAGPKDGWARLAKNLKAEIDEDLIESYRGTISLPFEPGDFKRAAVKIVDDRGIESLKIVEIG